MIETLMRIEGPDNNGIYGRLCTGEDPQDRLIIHLHGLAHYVDQFLEVTSRDFFVPHGFDHYRIWFCGFPKDSRKLSTSTISTHARDIQTVLDYFKNSGYKQIFVTAHSMAALAIMVSNPSGISAISLWDPSTDVMGFWEGTDCLTPHEDGEHYLLDYGNIFWIHKSLVEECKFYSHSKVQELVCEIKTPTQMITADEGIFTWSANIFPEDFNGKFSGPFELHKTPKACHNFAQMGSRDKLFEKTLTWFQKHS